MIEKTIAAILPKAKKLAADNIDVNTEESYAIQQLYKSEYNIDLAEKNPASVQNAFLNLVSIGVSLNPALKHAYLVPRMGGIVLDVSYIGLMALAQETGAIQWGQAKVVCENDTYMSAGIDKPPNHQYNAFNDRGSPIGVYCTVKLPSGDFLTEEMSRDEVMVIRNASKSKDKASSPWNTFEFEMWRKSVVKRAAKYWPVGSGARLEKAVQVINEHEGIDFTEAAPAENLSYSDEEFKENFPKWEETIKTKIKTKKSDAKGMLTFLETRVSAPFTKEQKKQILGVK